MHLEPSAFSENHGLMNELEHATNVPGIGEEIGWRELPAWTSQQSCYRANQHQQEGEIQMTAFKICQVRMVGRQLAWLLRLQRQHCEISQEAGLATPIVLH